VCELIQNVLKCVLLSENVQNHSLSLRKSLKIMILSELNAHNAYSVHLSPLFWVFKTLIHQIFSSKGNACPSCNILLTNENCQPHSFQLSLVLSASCQIFTLIFSGIFLVLWIYLVACIYCHHFCDKVLLNVYLFDKIWF
jgi:hypothetical protein